MAARKRKVTLDENWRTKIQTSMLINRLTDHVLGVIDLSQSQIRAIEILLKKTAPDLAQVQHTGDQDKPIVHTFGWAK